ncbi:prolyl oligopeptidase family serine peptidase [Pirellulaceae bacterium SH467]
MSRFRRISFSLALASSLLTIPLYADGPADNQVNSVRPIPPPGIEISKELRQELETGREQLARLVSELKKNRSTRVTKYLPDVEIFEKALRIALTENGFFEPRDGENAKRVLAEGVRRAEVLRSTEPLDWAGPLSLQDDLVTVRGFRSKLDGSVQPYGVVYRANGSVQRSVRADVWCRGRSEKGLELQFLAQRMTAADPMPAPGVLMIHPLGRYCNANKLAGEVDTLEALEHAKGEYPIDANGVAIRGFSMGGAAAWHLAVHYPDRWFAANPGAGFSETPKFLNVFQSEKLEPAPYEQTLWKLYDCPYWVNNLKNLPTIAYSGEIDKQKQAADVMAEAAWNQPESDRFELTHLIGPRTAHKIEPNTLKEVERLLGLLYAERPDGAPTTVDFTTYTLKYNQCHWLTIDGLKKHWEPARVQADVRKSTNEKGRASVTVHPRGVTSFTLRFDPGFFPEDISEIFVSVNRGDDIPAGSRYAHIKANLRSDKSVRFRLVQTEAHGKIDWVLRSPLDESQSLAKVHDLQGPIDDAFMSSFLFVKPTATGQHPDLDRWVQAEFERAVREWHRQMRGDIRVVSAEDLKDTDIDQNNIVLWGDPKSNPRIAAILGKLPLQWDAGKLAIGGNSYEASHHVPAMIYPNPQNPSRYVVLNSGFSYREYDYLNNARQVPKLPDWAVIDIRTAPDARWPGKVAAAGFFDEAWQVR